MAATTADKGHPANNTELPLATTLSSMHSSAKLNIETDSTNISTVGTMILATIDDDNVHIVTQLTNDPNDITSKHIGEPTTFIDVPIDNNDNNHTENMNVLRQRQREREYECGESSQQTLTGTIIQAAEISNLVQIPIDQNDSGDKDFETISHDVSFINV